MSRVIRREGFTLVELLVVVAIIALLLAILLPSLNKAVFAARQTTSQTHLRGIHQGFFNFAQSNNDLYPGLDRFDQDNAQDSLTNASQADTWSNTYNFDNNQTGAAGAYAGFRFALAVENELFPPEYLISPGEVSDKIVKMDVTRTDYDGNDQFYSYSLPRLANSLGNPGSLTDGRAYEWKGSGSPTAIIASDRLVRYAATTASDPTTHRSIWSGDEPGEWEGGISFNDGHVEWFESSVVERSLTYKGYETTGDDNLFVSAQPPGQTIPASDPPTHYNAHQIIRKHDTSLYITDP